jgi:hypothetical protein
MADREFVYLLEEIPDWVEGVRLEAYLQKAGELGWELVSVTPHRDLMDEGQHRYIFKLEYGTAKGTRPDKTW